MTTETTAPAAATRLRPRRSCLAVPGSSPRFLEKAQGLPADQVFLDLEDACAPLVKESARHAIVEVLNTGDWGGKTRVVRVNDWTTHWTYRDVVTVVVNGATEHVLETVRRQPFVREASAENGVVRLYVDRGETAVPLLLRVLDGAGLEAASIALHRPSLDDVFLLQTGRSLRDEAAA